MQLPTAIAPAILLAAALATSGCGGGSGSGSAHHSSTTQTTTRAKLTTSTVTSTRTSTTDIRPSPSPAGGPVPPGTKATSVTFISPATAFVLGTAPCRHAPCSVILRTHDRGRSWRGLAAPREAVSEHLGNGLWGLRFADAGHGYAYGNGFWQTANGGASWQQGGGPARFVLALEAVGDRELVAIAARCLPGQSHCRDTLGLYRRPISAGAWKLVGAAHTVAYGASIAVHGAMVWALAGNRLYFSGDGGASFRRQAQPCWPSHPHNGMPSSVSDDGSHIYLLCAGTGAAGSAEKFVFRVGRTASRWTRVGSPPLGGDPEGISAGGERSVMIAAASGASELYRSADAGAHWQTALSEKDGGAGWADLGFTTAADGVVVHGPAVSNGGNGGRPGELLLTDDGGRTWQRVRF